MKGDRLFTEQVKKIFDHTIFGWIGSLACAFTLAVVLWPVGDRTNIVIWFLCIISIELLRIYIHFWFKKIADSQISYTKWNNISLVTIFIDGLVWGSAGVFLFPVESTVHQVFIAFIIGGMVAGTVGLFSVMLSAFLTFSIPALFPVSLKFFLIDNPIHITMGFMLFLFWGIMFMTANRLKKDILNSLALKYQNVDLISALQNEVETRKSAERDLHKKNKEIENIVEERTSELKSTNIKLTHEIEERISIAKAFRESEAEYRDLIENINDVIFSIDINGIIDYMSPVVESITGYQASEVIGKRFSDFIYKEDQSLVTTRFHEVLAGRTHENEYRIVSKSGDFRWMRTSTRSITQDGHVIGLKGLFSDITERKKAEDALLKSEERFKILFEFAPDAYYLHDMNGHFLDGNRNSQELLGYRKTDLIGKNFIEAGIIVPKDHNKVIRLLARNKDGEATGPDEFTIKKTNGQMISVEVMTHPINLDGQEVVLGTARDITDRKSIQEQLRQSYKMEAIGTLTGGVAHDFNNILGIIIGNTELALDSLPDWNPAYSNLEDIKTVSLKAAGIVKQLLGFSRKTSHELKPVEIVNIVEESLHFLRSTIPATIEIKKNLPTINARILADPVQVNQIIMNLCINAAQEMELTGGVLEINVGLVTLDEESAKFDRALHAGDFIRLSVRDTGPGIESGIIDKIFDPYFTTKEIGKGSGMGLAVVLGIVRSHHGVITVDSSPGEGTTFILLFPAITEKPEVQSDMIDALPVGTETILFVDDEKSIANVTGQILKRLGYHVETRLSPLEAIEAFQLNPDQFDLVITDMAMPEMSGVTLFEQLKEIRPDVPVIICTGHSSMINAEIAQKMGISAYVMKPIVRQEIAAIVRKVLDDTRISAKE